MVVLSAAQSRTRVCLRQMSPISSLMGLYAYFALQKVYLGFFSIVITMC
jgi:hypothetical protein